MTDWLLSLVPEYGAWLLAVCTFCSCVAVPIPASILMLAAGGFVAAGDLSLPASAGASLAGAVVGDQAGYLVGRMGGSAFMQSIESRAAPLAKATALLARRGGIAVFLSRWLVSALGPYVNLAAGAAHQPWPNFTLWAIAGEVVWVTLYVGLGYLFTGNLEAASSMAIELLGFLAAGTITIGLAAWLIVTLRSEGRK